jgi:hypothetical protein
MKYIIALWLVLVLTLFLAACSGSADKPGSSATAPSVSQGGNSASAPTVAESGGTAIQDVSIDNWQAVIKDYFGLDISIPDGWSVNSAASLNGKSDVTVEFDAGGSEELLAFAETVFDQAQAVSTDGMKETMDDIALNSFDEATVSMGFPAWVYFYGSGNSRVQVMVTETYDGFIELSIDGLTK